jgi:hypothetical protein
LKTKTLLDLRQQIADELGQAPEGLTLFEQIKFGNNSELEITLLYRTIAAAYLERCTIIVSTVPQNTVIQLEHYAPDYSGEFIADKNSLFKPLEVPEDLRSVVSGLSVADFLSRLAETPAVAALLAGKPASHLRLREKTYYDSAGKIYPVAHCFKTDIALDYQKLPFLVEILPGVLHG